jgi:hypothetical protein
MATIIEFYIPENARKPRVCAPEQQPGKAMMRHAIATLPRSGRVHARGVSGNGVVMALMILVLYLWQLHS